MLLPGVLLHSLAMIWLDKLINTNQVVPDSSSTLDDPREHAETISANHMDMCRFSTNIDPGYRKVLGELQTMLRSISDQGECHVCPAFLNL
jgi:hypothetical protein